MDFIQLIFIEILAAYVLVWGIIMYGKPLAKSGTYLLTVPVSFFLTAFLMYEGVLSFSGELAFEFLKTCGKDVTEIVDLGKVTVGSIVTAVVNILAFTIVFCIIEFILLIVARIIYGIVSNSIAKGKDKKAASSEVNTEATAEAPSENAATANESAENGSVEGNNSADVIDAQPVAETIRTEPEKNGKKEKTKRPMWERWCSALVGGVMGLLICVFSFYPITALLNIVDPVLDKATDPGLEGTEIYNAATVLNDNIPGSVNGNIITEISRVQPVKLFFDMADGMIANVVYQSKDGSTVEFNLLHTLTDTAEMSVDLLSAYFYVMDGEEHTVGELLPVADVIDKIAENPAVLKVGFEAIKIAGANADEDPMLKWVYENVLNGYSDTEVMKNDLLAIKGVLTEFINGQSELPISDVKDRVFDMTEDKEMVTGVIEQLSKLHFYNDVIVLGLDYVMNIFCDTIGVYETEAEYVQAFENELKNSFNNGTFDISTADTFIIMSAKDKVAVKDYLPSMSNPSTMDKSYTAAKEYMKIYKNNIAILASYVKDTDEAVYYFGSDNNIYKYNDTRGYFEKCEGASEGSVAALIMMTEHPSGGEDIFEFFGKYNDSSYIRNNYPAVKSDNEKNILDYIGCVVNAKTTSHDVVTKETIVNSIERELPPEKVTAASDDFAELISKINFIMNISNGGGAVFENALGSFGEIGGLIDVLFECEYTENVPELLLTAISENANYRKYFDGESVTQMVENKKNGTGSFRNIFTSIQALYLIASEIA